MRPFTCHCSSAGTSSTPSNPTLQRIRAPWPLAESRCWPRHRAKLVLQWHGHSTRPSAVVSREALPALRKKTDKVGEGARFHRAGKRVTWPSICIRPRQTCTVFQKYLHVQEMISRNDSRPLQLLFLGACTCRKRWRFGLFMALDSGFSKHRCIWPFPKNSKAYSPHHISKSSAMPA